jgi:hypothetical protein
MRISPAIAIPAVLLATLPPACGRATGDGRTARETPVPDAAAFLPPLPGFRVDDEVDAGEIRESLGHGDVPYVEVRRRLLLDAEGFGLGDVMVVTFEAGSDGGERFLDHWYGDADRESVEIAGVEMQRIAADPHDALAWVGPDFIVVFSRGVEMTPARLEEVARLTVEGANRT